MKKMLMVAMMVCLFAGFSAQAQSNKVTGKLDIKFNTRTQVDDSGNPTEGIKDVYILDMQVTDSMIFGGKIESTPTIMGSMGNEKQQAGLVYDIMLSIRNPANPAQTKMVGKFVGGVPIDKKGIYYYDKGTLRIAVDAAGKASEFQSSFRGQAVGKPAKGGAKA